MKQVIFLICCLPVLASAQDEEAIQWTREPGWEQVKERAKKENKYIFIDCYATWCAPCKKMDKDVYSVDSVGDFFNEKFISVKMQMDVTPKDDAYVQAWRSDAKAIARQYKVGAFPTFLFFTPEGVLADKKMGFHQVDRFMVKARAALTPGKVYIDPLARYEQLMQRYAAGEKLYDSMYYMFKTAISSRDTANVRKLAQDLNGHLEGLPKEEWFTKERLDYMQAVTVSPQSKWFKVFYRYPQKVNGVINDEQYAQRVVEKAMLDKVAYPYIGMKSPGMMVMVARKRIKADKAEADWEGLEKKLSKEFDGYYARRVTLAARFTWYKQHWNLDAFMNAYWAYLDHYGMNAHVWTTPNLINDFAYNIAFLAIDDKDILKKAVSWMKKVVGQVPMSNMLDTYASLLYKVGEHAEAIKWEELALQKATLTNNKTQMTFFTGVIDKMKQGEKLDWWED